MAPLQSIENLLERVKNALIAKNNFDLLEILQQISTKLLVNKSVPIKLSEFIFIFDLIDNHKEYHQEIIAQILVIFYSLTLAAEIEDYENFLKVESNLLCQLNYLIYNCSDFSIEIIEILLFVLETIIKKSKNCLELIIQNNFVSTVRFMIEQIDLTKNEACLLNLFGFLSTFVDQKFNLQFKELSQVINIINRICKQLLKLDYFNIDDIINSQNLEAHEFKITLIARLLTLIKYYVDKIGVQLDLEQQKNIWKIVKYINFSNCQLEIFQKITSYIIFIQSQGCSSIIRKFYQNNPDLLDNIFQCLLKQKDKFGDGEKIRINTAGTLRNLYQYHEIFDKSINVNELVEFIEYEKSQKVLPYLLESFYFLLKRAPNAKYLTVMEQWLKYSYESENWLNLKWLLLCIQEISQVDEMKSLRESLIYNYITLLTNKGSEQIKYQALRLLDYLDQ